MTAAMLFKLDMMRLGFLGDVKCLALTWIGSVVHVLSLHMLLVYFSVLFVFYVVFFYVRTSHSLVALIRPPSGCVHSTFCCVMLKIVFVSCSSFCCFLILCISFFSRFSLWPTSVQSGQQIRTKKQLAEWNIKSDWSIDRAVWKYCFLLSIKDMHRRNWRIKLLSMRALGHI